MLNTSLDDPYRGFTLPDSSVHLALGALLSPREFAQECLTFKQRPLYDGYAIRLQLPDAWVNQLQSALVPKAHAIALLLSAQGIPYCLVTLQAAALQLRLLLTFAEPAVHEWFLGSIASGSMTLALEIPETNQLAVIELPCCREVPQGVLTALRSGVERDLGLFIADMALMARETARLDAIESLVPGFAVTELRVYTVFAGSSTQASLVHETKGRVLN